MKITRRQALKVGAGVVGSAATAISLTRPVYHEELSPLVKREVNPQKRLAIFFIPPEILKRQQKDKALSDVATPTAVVSVGAATGLGADALKKREQTGSSRRGFIARALKIAALGGAGAYLGLSSREDKTYKEEAEARDKIMGELRNAGYQVKQASNIHDLKFLLEWARVNRSEDARTFIFIDSHGGRFQKPIPLGIEMTTEKGRKYRSMEMQETFIHDGKEPFGTTELAFHCAQIPGHIIFASRACHFPNNIIERGVRSYINPDFKSITTVDLASEKEATAYGNYPMYNVIREGIRDPIDIRDGIRKALFRQLKKIPMLTRIRSRFKNSIKITKGLIREEENKNLTL